MGEVQRTRDKWEALLSLVLGALNTIPQFPPWRGMAHPALLFPHHNSAQGQREVGVEDGSYKKRSQEPATSMHKDD